MSSPFDPDEFRRALHRAADLAADYVEGVGEHPVLPRVERGDLLAVLPEGAPEEGEDFDALLDDFQRLVVPGVTHWNHPGFLAYFSSNASEPGILGEMLAGALGVNAMLWHTSPAATELEVRVCDWMRRALGLPDGFHGHINDTASISTFLALAAARDAASSPSGEALDVRHRGLQGAPAMTVYCSDQTHSSIDKAVIALGLGLDHLRHVESDGEFRMDPAALERAIEADRRAGRLPIAVVATLGTTSTTSNDPVAAIAEICRRHGLFLHVDAAWAGTAALCPELRRPFDGWERADSIVVNPHKWMATPLDCSLLFVRDPDALRAAFSLVPEYLRTDESTADSPEARAAQVNLMDFGVQLGRRFRSLKLWYVLRSFGLERLRENVRRHLRWAAWVEEQVEDEPGFELAAPMPWSVVCLRATLGESSESSESSEAARGEREDELNARILEAVNRRGEIFLSHTKLDGRYVIRVAVSNLRTEERHVHAAWEQIRDEAERLRGKV